MRPVWLLEGEIVHLIEILSRMCGEQTRLSSPVLALVLNIAGKKTQKKQMPCVSYVLIITILFFSTEVVVFLKVAAVPLRPSAVIQLRRLQRADPCVECPRGTEAHSWLDGRH